MIAAIKDDLKDKLMGFGVEVDNAGNMCSPVESVTSIMPSKDGLSTDCLPIPTPRPTLKPS